VSLRQPARTAGTPLSRGRIRAVPADFEVVEQLGFEPAGAGVHELLWVEKSGWNTVDVARTLARHAGVPARDVGYSGLKDRHALCRQWFSVPFTAGVDWVGFEADGLRILECHRHDRKLRRGAHPHNRFRIVVELSHVERGDLARRLQQAARCGVPNYFGEQRFGREFRSNAERLAQGGKLPRFQRSMTLSALRAELFNRVLDGRVRLGNWDAALPGEYLNLDGTRSGFTWDGVGAEVPRRVRTMDVHPTGPLCGRGGGAAAGEAARLEADILADDQPWRELLAREGLRADRRATRALPRDMRWELCGAGRRLELEMTLRRGQFATSVLREILDYQDVTAPRPGQRAGVDPDLSRQADEA